MESSRYKRIKLLAAAAAAIASVFVAVGAAVAVGQQPTGTLMQGTMSVGQTATTTTPPPMEPTAKAVPAMKATPPKGF